MSKKFVVAIAFLALFTFGCKKQSIESPSAESHGYFQTHWQDESQFIVENTMSDLAEEIYYAKFHRLPKPENLSVSAAETSDSKLGAPVYELQVDLDKDHRGLKMKLNVDGAIWSPEIYRGAVAQMAQSLMLAVTEQKEMDDTTVLGELTDSEALTVERENQKLSKALQNNFTNPALHAQAAVVLGAFTLREHAGDFCDIRSPLCRMTAHLAFADFLRGKNAAGINRQIAEAMLLTLMNDESAALEKLNDIPTNDAALISWTRALRAWNTRDYRPLDQLNNLSRVEAIARFYALDTSVNSDIAWSRLSDVQKRVPDFVRIASGSYSVGEGHELLAVAMPLELNELAAVYSVSQKKKLTKKELVPALNQMPDHCFSVGADGKTEVCIIGWGQWAGFFQRQLCHALQSDFNFLQWQWGVPDEAKKFSQQSDQMFGGLRLYPFVRRFNCTDIPSFHKSVDDGFKVTVATPQLVPAECWNYLCYRFEGNEYKPNPNPHVNEWHKHNPPPGTAYNPLPRLDHPSLINHPEAVDKLHEMAPYDRNIAWYIWKAKYNQKPTYEQAAALFRPVLDYDYYAMEKVADTVHDQPDKYEELLSKAAALNPSDYFKLANYFEQRDADKAAVYIEKGNSSDPDSVRASYYASWLIRYYLKNARTNDASREADFAGDVYSSVGLQAKAEFLEATGDYSGAFLWYSNIEERYGESGPLIAFCARYKAKTGDTRYDDEFRQRIGKLFPKGIEKVSLSEFHSPPTDGVAVNEATDLARAAGLKIGDVIVAVYGIRVHNFAQYDYGRDSKTDPDLDLIVWQGNGYREIKTSPPNHRFGGDFGNYITR